MGVLIEFYKPQPKPPAEPVPEVVERAAVGDILRELLGKAETIDDVLVIMRDKDGGMGLVGNLESPAESLLFMLRIQNYIVNSGTVEESPAPKGTV